MQNIRMQGCYPGEIPWPSFRYKRLRKIQTYGLRKAQPKRIQNQKTLIVSIDTQFCSPFHLLVIIMTLSKWLSSARQMGKNLDFSRQAIIAKIQQNPYYRFQSPTEIQIAGEVGIKIDVNLASVDDWLRIPGISITQARNLVEMTNSGIHFLCLEDLAAALGVSVLKIQYWQPILYFAYYSAESWHAPPKVKHNDASISQLLTIPNLDSTIAENIISDRQANGNYRNLADLQKRLGLTPDFTYHLMYYLLF